jgi:hypothetical protein
MEPQYQGEPILWQWRPWMNSLQRRPIEKIDIRFEHLPFAVDPHDRSAPVGPMPD